MDRADMLVLIQDELSRQLEQLKLHLKDIRESVNLYARRSDG